MAEAKVIKMDIEFASVLPFSRMIIESECKVVIDAVRDSSSFVEWDLIGILDDIAFLAGAFEVIDAFASRFANRTAHWLAFHEKNAIILKDRFSNIPLELSNILLSDFEASGIGLVVYLWVHVYLFFIILFFFCMHRTQKKTIFTQTGQCIFTFKV